MFGAPEKNDFLSEPVERLTKLNEWIGYFNNMGINALYLGPLFESSEHGYDTADYYKVDRRLGTNNTLKQIVDKLHQNNIRVILDGVFNHVGRDFRAFKDVKINLENSSYREWFGGLNFAGTNCYNDPFVYEGWNGNYNLVKLNLLNPHVVNHLFEAIRMWITEFDIDGLRLDVADCLDKTFLKQLNKFCKSIKKDFWLMGEVIHGDYRNWVSPDMLDSVTNYECYKGLYSSHVDKNYFEIAYSLNRQFGEGGIYEGFSLYNFADNHDVNRVVNSLSHPEHLYPLYFLLFSMPGVPSVYYGSEWGIEGKKNGNCDRALRPAIEISDALNSAPHPELKNTIAKLIAVRKKSRALKYGFYKQIHVNHEQFVFLRTFEEENILIAVNSNKAPVQIEITLDGFSSGAYKDQMTGEFFTSENGSLSLTLWPNWGRVLMKQA
jgi:glycosidase